MTRRAPILIPLLLGGCLPFAAPPPPASPLPLDGVPAGLRVSVAERYYEVRGTSAGAVNLALALEGPVHEGTRWHGITDFDLRYSYVPEPVAGGCRAGRPQVRVGIVSTLPRWTDRNAAPEPLRWDWDLFLVRLRAHERGHQEITIRGGRALLRAVAEARARSCAALRTEVRRTAEALEGRFDREHRGWDRRTAHGLLAAGG